MQASGVRKLWVAQAVGVETHPVLQYLQAYELPTLTLKDP